MDGEEQEAIEEIEEQPLLRINNRWCTIDIFLQDYYSGHELPPTGVLDDLLDEEVI